MRSHECHNKAENIIFNEDLVRPDKIRDEDPDPVGSVDFFPAGSGTFFYWIRILPETTDLKNCFHLEQNIYQN